MHHKDIDRMDTRELQECIDQNQSLLETLDPTNDFLKRLIAYTTIVVAKQRIDYLNYIFNRDKQTH